MIAVDTNVLVRYFTQDDPQQAAAAERVIEHSGEECFISVLVLCELTWVLTGYGYSYSKPLLAGLLQKITSRSDVVLENHDVLLLALDDYIAGTAEFADYVIIRLAEQQGAKKFYTFDKKAARHSFAMLLTH